MRGWSEILLSFTLGLAALTAFTFIQRTDKANRNQPQNTPVEIAGQPEDARLSLSWGLEHIGATRAWKRAKGDRKIVVAIIDTGCDITHRDLKRSIWSNRGESGLDENGMSKATNGLDDDDNGFVDDIHGWNFVEHTPDVTDDNGHGTHIAGIIGARSTDGSGLRGVAPDVSLMILKYFDEGADGTANLRNTIAAIRYAVRMGAQIINYSGGGMMKSREEENMIRWAAEQGVLVVAAAGNEGMNSDFFHFYPADYDLANILSVGALDRNGQMISVSNHGLHTVDIAAPGKNIYSTLPGGAYGYMTGTSQATAFATGTAALLLAQDERAVRNPAIAISRMTEGGRALASLKGKTRTGRMIDVVGTLTIVPTEIAGGFDKPASSVVF